ncbi:hypothetical protein D3C84_1193640 [compost metagenome]
MGAERLNYAHVIKANIERQPECQPEQQHIDRHLQEALFGTGKGEQLLTQRGQISFHLTIPED